ncbi:MAG: GGDEF domain-containing protein [bacterium]
MEKLSDFEKFSSSHFKGIVIYSHNAELEFVQHSTGIWKLAIPSSIDSSQIKPICSGYMKLIKQLFDFENRTDIFQSMFKCTKQDNLKHTSYINTVRTFLYSRLQDQNEWTIKALTKLVEFTVIKLDSADIKKYPELIIDFLGGNFFNLSYFALLRLNEDEMKWDYLAEKGVKDIEIDIPPFDIDTNIEDKEQIFDFFKIKEQAFVLVLSCASTNRFFKSSEYTFFSLFVALISSFYQQKQLSDEMKKRVTEIDKLRLAKDIENNLSSESSTIENAFSHIYEKLPSVKDIVLAEYDEKEDKMNMLLSKNTAFDNWELFLKNIFTTEEFFPEEWMVFPLFEGGEAVYGAAAVKFSRNNENQNRIDEEIINYIIPQIVTVLTRDRIYSEVHKQAVTDPLTGASNRREGFQILKERIYSAMNDREKKLSVAMLDIDFFKKVNDVYGHKAGDIVLQHLVATMRKMLRDDDVICRYGGEEFLLIMNVDLPIMKTIMERLRKKIESTPINTEKHVLKITVSIGVCTYRGKTSDPESLVEQADANLYKAKENGRNRVITSMES